MALLINKNRDGFFLVLPRSFVFALCCGRLLQRARPQSGSKCIESDKLRGSVRRTRGSHGCLAHLWANLWEMLLIDIHCYICYSDIAVCRFVSESGKVPRPLQHQLNCWATVVLAMGPWSHVLTRSKAAMLHCRKVLPARTRPRFVRHDVNHAKTHCRMNGGACGINSQDGQCFKTGCSTLSSEFLSST